ncbi:hypothetical protein NPIL_113621 [Nephila pilipes]|uniref:Uncharacterized protein n=1 Tax=Nephila pilipes TaxID=299642 RepID=A0A8X6TB48_NEPPI|nr:hypothetical protein NPIL_639821 [Nephila pilipes]GFU12663.1 hypothetical protein NPIL_113621 [Nephila pilipes]
MLLTSFFCRRSENCPKRDRKFQNLKENTMRHIRVSILKDEHSSNRLSYNCPKVKKGSEYTRPSNSEVQTCFVVPQKGLYLRDITLDEDLYSLTWHVVPTEHLYFNAVIGDVILKQASLNFTQNGVKFHKQEEKAWLMQISELHLEDDSDLSH